MKYVIKESLRQGNAPAGCKNPCRNEQPRPPADCNSRQPAAPNPKSRWISMNTNIQIFSRNNAKTIVYIHTLLAKKLLLSPVCNAAQRFENARFAVSSCPSTQTTSSLLIGQLKRRSRRINRGRIISAPAFGGRRCFGRFRFSAVFVVSFWISGRNKRFRANIIRVGTTIEEEWAKERTVSADFFDFANVLRETFFEMIFLICRIFFRFESFCFLQLVRAQFN